MLLSDNLMLTLLNHYTKKNGGADVYIDMIKRAIAVRNGKSEERMIDVVDDTLSKFSEEDMYEIAGYFIKFGKRVFSRADASQVVP